MAADFQNVTIVNIYATSGTERTRDKENHISNELPYLLWGIPPSLLDGGDFNSVLTNLDATGHSNYRRAMQEFITGFDLVDMWETAQELASYTHYTNQGASRFDRKRASRNLNRHKRGADTGVAAFTHHLAVVIRIALEATTMQRGRSYWKMNTALHYKESFQEQVR